jgi:hypothetical protein
MEDLDRFAVQAEAAWLPILFLISHLIFLHKGSPLVSELNRHGPASPSGLDANPTNDTPDREARLQGEIRHPHPPPGCGISR